MGEKLQKVLKYYILIVSGFIAACGIGIIVLTLVWLKLEDYVPNDEYIDYVKYFKYTLYGIGAWLIEIGIIGILSGWKQNRCVILIFQIQIIFFALIFLGIGISVLFFAKKVVDDLSCSNLDILSEADEAIKKSSNMFCTTQCPCNCENAEVLAYITQRNSASALNSVINGFISTSGVVKSQDCSSFDTLVGADYREVARVLGFLEEKFSCSGLCQINQLYLFSNINNGTPENMCWQKIIDEMKKFINIMGSIGMGVGGILLITVIVAFFLCCKRKSNKVQDDDMNYNQVNQKNSEINEMEQKIDDTF